MRPTLLGLALACLALAPGCEPSKRSPPRDSASVSGRLAAESEAVVRPYGGGEETKLKGLVEDVMQANSPRGRDVVTSGTRVIVVDDTMTDLHHNIPGSRDVAVRLKDGRLEGKPAFIARTDLRPATNAATPKPK